MKNIKLKLVAWLVGLFISCSLLYAQGSFTLDIPNYRDSINLDVDVDVVSDPVNITLSWEEFTKDSAAQAMLQAQQEQTNMLNENLIDLNESINLLPGKILAAKKSVLDEYNFNPRKIDKTIRTVNIVRNFFIILAACVALWGLLNDDKIYYYPGRMAAHLTKWIIVIIIIIAISEILKYATVDNYYIWSSIGKLL